MSDRKRPFTLYAEGDEPGRLLALSDGLFATVLTILVLDLKLPQLASDASNLELTRAFAQLWPHLFGYFLTFIVTGLHWLAHHRYFNYVVRYNRRLLWLNLSFLLFIGLVPFSTAAVSSSGPIPFFWTVYAANMIGCGVTLALTWGYAYSHGLVDPDLPPEFSRYLTLRSLVLPALFVVSIPISYLTPDTNVAQLFLLLAPVIEGVLDRRHQRRDPVRMSARQAWSERLWGLAAMLPLLLLFALVAWAIFFNR